MAFSDAAFVLWRPMSLRFRLIGLVCAVLLISLGLGGGVAYSNAKRSVRTEMQAALAVGRHTIETALAQLREIGDASGDLDRLVAAFDGDRHLRVWLDDKVPALASRSKVGRVPDWFVRLIGIAPQVARIPVAITGSTYKTIFIQTDPKNEAAEVWDEFTAGLVAPAVFCGLTVLLIYVFIGRIARPLGRFADALAEVGEGDYRTRFGGRLPSELTLLRDSFNRMATRLAEADADNRRLNEQLLSLQEQERSELARDLHDEVSPFLFAIGVDAAAVSRLAAQERGVEVVARAQSIAEAVRHIQRQVRRMLGRLRPIGLVELGLRRAIEDIVEFWRRRRPEIRYDVTVAPGCDGLPEVTAQTICRIVQEGVSNAVRHALPTVVTIVVDRAHDPRGSPQDVVVEIADDGRGAAAPPRVGYGLRGIGERVSAIGGTVTLGDAGGIGFRLTAVLPCSPSAGCIAAPLEASEL